MILSLFGVHMAGGTRTRPGGRLSQEGLCMSTIEVNIVLPEEVLSFARLGKEEIREEMRRLLLLELVREGKVPYGKAAELLGIGQAEFLQYMAQHKSLPSNLHRRNSLRSWGQSNEGCLQQWAIDQSSQSGPIHPAARLVPAHHDPTSSLRGGSRTGRRPARGRGDQHGPMDHVRNARAV